MLERGYEEAWIHVTRRLKTELLPVYHYHQLDHTLFVIQAAVNIAGWEGVNGQDLMLLKTAALYHDTGFLINHTNHEELSVQIATQELPGFGFDDEQIERINRMILATKLPQSPTDELGRILCDADLFYLGTDLFSTWAELLFQELQELGTMNDRDIWMAHQVRFLKDHHYHIPAVASHLNEKKSQHLEELLNKL